jgi:hypothetical protein
MHVKLVRLYAGKDGKDGKDLPLHVPCRALKDDSEVTQYSQAHIYM